MDEIVNLWDKPEADEIYMIVGWNQWADAGAISSGLPLYLIHKTDAQKIGEIEDDGFYIFQIPGTHHFLRPEIQLEEGYRTSLSSPSNEFYYTEIDGKGLVIFIGEEPHLKADRYTEALLNAAEELNVRRIAAVGGVYGAMPYDRDRDVSCVYSLPEMKAELENYSVRFSNYEGGTTIGTYMVDRAERHGLEFIVFYAFVPAYNFGEVSNLVQTISIETDFKAWYDLMRRFNHMFDMEFDLTELENQSYELIVSMDAKIEEIDEQVPDLDVQSYLEELAEEFEGKPFVPPLSDVWGRALDNLFDEDIDIRGAEDDFEDENGDGDEEEEDED